LFIPFPPGFKAGVFSRSPHICHPFYQSLMSHLPLTMDRTSFFFFHTGFFCPLKRFPHPTVDGVLFPYNVESPTLPRHDAPLPYFVPIFIVPFSFKWSCPLPFFETNGVLSPEGTPPASFCFVRIMVSRFFFPDIQVHPNPRFLFFLDFPLPLAPFQLPTLPFSPQVSDVFALFEKPSLSRLASRIVTFFPGRS